MRVALALMACLLVTPALAQPTRQPAPQQTPPTLPEWDRRDYCERSMRTMAVESAFMLRACLDQEERAFNMVRESWAAMPAASLRGCVRNMETLRANSYFLLNACVEQERGALRDLERRPR